MLNLTEDKGNSYIRAELPGLREAGRFSRIITLPSQVETGKVDAICTDGILTLKLPKVEAATPRKIAVKAN